jgi:dimethylhistidine N-methyltransferase
MGYNGKMPDKSTRLKRRLRWHDFKPGRERFRADVLAGLRQKQKELPCKYFYDERGSRLYERICQLEEYYIPRTEAAIMRAHIGEMAQLIGRGARIIEYGCGNCEKVRFLLDHLDEPVAYVPIDISKKQLKHVSEGLSASYPRLEVLPVCADYTSRFVLPAAEKESRRAVVYFPGSTISNFDPLPAQRFLAHMAEVCGPGGGLLIGVDLKKDPAVLHRAYNDIQGVTAAFNLNLLERINSELGADFQLENFEHQAFYNQSQGRVEMHLVSQREQTVNLDGVSIPLAEGESIWTESSYKYSLDEFAWLAATTGWRVVRVWTDDKRWFSVQYLVNTGA